MGRRSSSSSVVSTTSSKHNTMLRQFAPFAPVLRNPVPRPTILDLETGRGVQEYGLWGLDDLRAICAARNIQTRPTQTKTELLQMLTKSHLQALVYEAFTLDELVEFVQARCLEVDPKCKELWRLAIDAPLLRRSAKLASTPSTALSTLILAQNITSTMLIWSKRLAIDILEAADRRFKFNFGSLPPELRTKIYLLTCKSSSTIMRPNQPAITKVCRLLREEALPLYYHLNRFGVFCPTKYFNTLAMILDPPLLPRVVLQDNAWLKSMPPQNLALVRSFEFVSLERRSGLSIDLDTKKQDYTIEMRQYMPDMFCHGTSSEQMDGFCRALYFREREIKKREQSKDPAQLNTVIERAAKGIYMADQGLEKTELSLMQQLKLLDLEWKHARGFSVTSLANMVCVLTHIGDRELELLWSHENLGQLR